jgi:hypothetical protein
MDTRVIIKAASWKVSIECLHSKAACLYSTPHANAWSPVFTQLLRLDLPSFLTRSNTHTHFLLLVAFCPIPLAIRFLFTHSINYRLVSTKPITNRIRKLHYCAKHSMLPSNMQYHHQPNQPMAKNMAFWHVPFLSQHCTNHGMLSIHRSGSTGNEKQKFPSS